jgi:hypothetical protein
MPILLLHSIKIGQSERHALSANQAVQNPDQHKILDDHTARKREDRRVQARIAFREEPHGQGEDADPIEKTGDGEFIEGGDEGLIARRVELSHGRMTSSRLGKDDAMNEMAARESGRFQLPPRDDIGGLLAIAGHARNPNPGVASRAV